MRFSSLLGASALCLATATAVSPDVALPAVSEVDLVFPQNDTYLDSVDVFPVVFAFQRPQLAAMLYPSLYYMDLYNLTAAAIGNSSQLDNYQVGGFNRGLGGISLRWANLTTSSNGSDPFLVYTYTGGFANTTTNTSSSPTTKYMLRWRYAVSNCSATYSGGGGGASSLHSVVFSIGPNGKKPDLVEATSDKRLCSNNGYQTYNITAFGTGQLPDDHMSYFSQGCAAWSPTDPSPAGNPCAVEIASASAASISASITAAACRLDRTWMTDCPKRKKSGAAAATAATGTGGYVALATVVLALWLGLAI